MPAPILYIGNKNYSSWSMRPWLALTWGGVDFEERLIPIAMAGYGKSIVSEILAASPSGRIPALHLGDAVIWDSLAICEWAAEQNPALWPGDPILRGQARAAAAEMHSGFAGVRRDLPMNVRRRAPPRTFAAADTQKDLARLDEMLSTLRAAHGGQGPYLFGARSIADAFYVPVATRLRTYGVTLSAPANAYRDTLLADPAFRAWEQAGEAESWTHPAVDEA